MGFIFKGTLNAFSNVQSTKNTVEDYEITCYLWVDINLTHRIFGKSCPQGIHVKLLAA